MEVSLVDPVQMIKLRQKAVSFLEFSLLLLPRERARSSPDSSSLLSSLPPLKPGNPLGSPMAAIFTDEMYSVPPLPP